MGKRSFIVYWASIFVACAMAPSAIGQDVDSTALIHETQKIQRTSSDLSMVWWIPSEFWAASFSRSKEMSASQAERFLKVVQPYVIIAAFEGTIGIFGAVDYKPEERIRADIRLVDAEGTEYKPRADAEINADLKNLLSIMKPIIANMLGPLGQNLHFFVFPAETEAGARIIKPTEKGHFQVKLGEKEYKWRLPLDSLLPGKVCPNCSEACKGSWSFCPWCGTKLAENPETHKP